jgi:site-specific recombinase XerD
MVRRFRQWLTAQRYIPSTVKKYGMVCEGFCSFLGDKPMREVTPMDVSDFITSNVKKEWGESVVNNRLGTLRTFFDFLYMGGVVNTVPPRFIRPRRRAMKLPTVLTPDQVEQLLERTTNLRERAFLEFLYASGCRQSEALLLRLGNIDLDQRTALVSGKRKERIVYFGAQAETALRRYIGRRKSGYVFTIEYRQQRGHVHVTSRKLLGYYATYETGKRVKQIKYLGAVGRTSMATAKRKFENFLRRSVVQRPVPDRPLCNHTAWKILTEAARRIGLCFVPGGMLRHSFATHLCQNGADMSTLQALLGHSCLSSTQVYLRLSDPHVAEQYKRLHPRGA